MDQYFYHTQLSTHNISGKKSASDRKEKGCLQGKDERAGQSGCCKGSAVRSCDLLSGLLNGLSKGRKA